MKQAGLLMLLLLSSPLFVPAQTNEINGNLIKDWLILDPLSGNNIDQDYLESVSDEANIDPKAGDTIWIKTEKYMPESSTNP